jgi:hypothetical protein
MSGLAQTLVRSVLVSNALLLLSCLFTGALHLGATCGWAPARGAVRALRGTVVLALGLPFAQLLFQGALPVRFRALAVAAGTGAQARLAGTVPEILRPSGGGDSPWLVLAAALSMVGVALALWRAVGYARLISQVRARPLLRRVGRVELRLAEEGWGPASVRLPDRAVVLLPEPLLLSPEDLRIALGHELEHHRRGDAAWAVIDTLLRALFFWNPALHLLSRFAGEWQELACDDALLARRRVSPGAYAACLVRTAERALRPTLSPATVGMAAHRSTTLRKRVDRMFKHRAEKSWAVKLATGTAVLGLSASALAAGAAVNEPQTHGELSKAAIQQTIRSHLSAVKGCYEQALEAQPELHGKLVVHFVIGVTGAVRSAEASTVDLSGPSPESTTVPETVKDAGDRVSSCVVTAVKGWTFPRPQGGEVTVSYPFQFGPR